MKVKMAVEGMARCGKNKRLDSVLVNRSQGHPRHCARRRSQVYQPRHVQRVHIVRHDGELSFFLPHTSKYISISFFRLQSDAIDHLKTLNPIT